MSKSFDDLISRVAACSKKKVAVAVAQDSAVLESIQACKERGIADAILVGDRAKIEEVAASLNMNLSDYEIIHEEDDYAAALKAVSLVHNKQADMYMKGLIDTKSFLRSVLDKEVGLRTGRPLSHICVFEIEGVDRLMFLADVAFMTYPTLEDKASIIKNSVEICHACGVTMPKVAPLAAVEVVNPKMQATVDAAELTKMGEAGEFPGCIVDGPLSYDLALNRNACIAKGQMDRKITGDADLLIFPDIHAGNITYKCLVDTSNTRNGNILAGTSAPVILTSRSDEFETKVNSIALAAVVAEAMNK